MKTLWAIEPFHQKSKSLQQVYRLVKNFSVGQAEIDVGFISTGTESQLVTSYDIDEKIRFTDYPRTLIESLFKKEKIDIKKEKIFVRNKNTFSTSIAVYELLKLAKSRNAKLICLFTKAEVGLSRIFLGSFAEELMHQSRLPVLLISPKSKVVTNIKKIIYACDFSKGYKKYLDKVVKLAKSTESELVVLHHSEFFLDKGAVTYNQNLYTKRVVGCIKQVEAELKKNKVKGRVVATNQLGSTSELITKQSAKENVDLIAIAAKSSALVSFLGGSVTRQVVSMADRPVLVVK
jgi:nucleotide-binding universal stress UspA family protein